MSPDSSSDIREIQSQIEAYILRLIAKREYSAHMIRQKCQQKFLKNNSQKSPLLKGDLPACRQGLGGFFSKEIISLMDQTIQNFTQKNYISDQRFTESLIRDQLRQDQGPQKILQKLHHYGIKKTLAQESLEKFYPEPMRQAIATDIFQKKKAVWIKRGKSAPEATQKSINYVQSRGFYYHNIKNS
jgi:SOS response regulatory protein OraA/RecX